MSSLVDKRCVPCNDPDIPKLILEEAEKLNKQIKDWKLEEAKNHLQISKEFKFGDFKESLEFVNKVGKIAEEQDHHPNLYIIYNKVKIVLFTYIIRGLHENDFIMAAKVDQAAKNNRSY